MKLVKKWREGSWWKRRYDRPQTAYERLVASGQLSRKEQVGLRDRYESLDPFRLAAETERRLKPILACAQKSERLAGYLAQIHLKRLSETPKAAGKIVYVKLTTTGLRLGCNQFVNHFPHRLSGQIG